MPPDEPGPQPPSQVKSYTLVAVLVVVFLVAGVTLSRVQYSGPSKLNSAILKAQKIEQAARVYRDEAGGTYPLSLDVLAVETPEGGPLLEGGLDAVTDPWGSPYHFRVEPDGYGGERFVVWTTAPGGTRIQ